MSYPSKPDQTIVMFPDPPPRQPLRLQLVVEYLNGQTRWYKIPEHTGWRIDPMYRQIVIGRGIPRIMIPLDSVASYHLEEL